MTELTVHTIVKIIKCVAWVEPATEEKCDICKYNEVCTCLGLYYNQIQEEWDDDGDRIK